jgi:hypothetical protein
MSNFRSAATPGSTGSSTQSTSAVRLVDSPVLESRYAPLRCTCMSFRLIVSVEPWTWQRSPPQPHSCSLHLEKAQHPVSPQIPLITFYTSVFCTASITALFHSLVRHTWRFLHLQLKIRAVTVVIVKFRRCKLHSTGSTNFQEKGQSLGGCRYEDVVELRMGFLFEACFASASAT